MADRRKQEDAAVAAAALPSLFYVKHHNDESILLNSKCPTAVLQDRLRKLAGADFTPDLVNVDLILAPENLSVGSSGSGGGGGAASSSTNKEPSGKSGKNAAEPLVLSDRLEHNGQPIYGNTFITSRATYILLAYIEDEDGIKIYKPLWKIVDASGHSNGEAEKLTAILEARSAEEKKKVGTKKGTKK
jgi:hypothetical protein